MLTKNTKYLLLILLVLLLSFSGCAKNQYTFEETKNIIENSTSRVSLNLTEYYAYTFNKEEYNIEDTFDDYITCLETGYLPSEVMIVTTKQVINYYDTSIIVNNNNIIEILLSNDNEKKTALAKVTAGVIFNIEDEASFEAIKDNVLKVKRNLDNSSLKINNSKFRAKGSYIYYGDNNFLDVAFPNTNEFLLLIVLISIPALCVIYYISSKRRKKLIGNSENNTNIIEGSIDDKENISIIDSTNTNHSSAILISFICLLIYTVSFYILPYIVSPIMISIYSIINNIPKSVLDPNSNLFDPEVYNKMAQLLNAVLQVVVYLICGIPLVILCFKQLVTDIKSFKKQYLLRILMGYGLIFGANIFSNILLTLLGANTISTNEQGIQSLLSTNVNITLLFIATVILAPIVEELVFRKSFFNVFKDKTLALLISSIMFGLIHVILPTIDVITLCLKDQAVFVEILLELIQIIPYATMGIVIGITYLMSNKNVYTTIGLHAMNNLISMIASITLLK